MLFFALLCPILIWPLYAKVKPFGFNQTGYILACLAGAGFAALVGMPLALRRIDPLTSAIGLQLIGIFAVHGLYLAVGMLSTPAENGRRVAASELEEQAAEEHRARIAAATADWICLKTYLSAAQQGEYLRDRQLLDRAGITYTASQGGITNLLVPPDQAERAAEALGL